MSRELLDMTALEMREKFTSRELSPVEVASAALAQIERLNDDLNAFCLVDPETTLELAAESERRYAEGAPRGLVDGVPVGVKDVFQTPMWPTVKGSRVIEAEATLG